MRSLYLVSLVCAGLAYGQAPVTRTVRLENLGSPQGLQEAATILRTVCDMRTVSVDTAAASISFTDSANTVALAEWTLTAIDVGGPMATQEYHLPGSADDNVKVVYLANTNSAQGVQELLTQLRTVVSLAKVFNVTGPRAIVFRGNSALIAASSWLIAQLDRTFDPSAAPASYSMSDGSEVRVYYLHNIVPPKPVQELLTAIRLETKTQHIFE